MLVIAFEKYVMFRTTNPLTGVGARDAMRLKCKLAI